MYDLFALGQLMDESMSGYLMKQILQQMVGQQRKISFGMIYPLLKRLHEAGYITIHEQEESGKRTKKVATITDLGRVHFQELMEQKVPLNQNLEFTYSVKFRNFHQVNVNLRRQILNDYKNHLSSNQNLLMKQSTDLEKTPISVSDLKNARWVISLEQAKIKAALEWVEISLRELDSEGEI